MVQYGNGTFRSRPYRRRAGYRGRKAAWYDKKYSALQLAKKAYTGVRYIKGLVNSEMYHHRLTGTAVNVTSTGAVVHLSGINQGDTSVTRTGNSVFCRGLVLRMRFAINATATTTFCRIMLVIDQQQVSDTDPSVTSVLQTADVLSTLHINQSGRYKILKSWLFSMDDARNQTRIIDHYQKLWHHIRFNGAASTDIQKGGMYLLYLSDQAVNYPVMDYESKLSYHDN